MSRIRGEGTAPERGLERALRAAGVRFLRQSRDLPGRPDIVVPSARLAVFVHGCFWHGCPRHYRAPKSNRGFWRRKLVSNRRRDERCRRTLRRMGWRTVAVWEHEAEPIRRILAALSRPRCAGRGRSRSSTRRRATA